MTMALNLTNILNDPRSDQAYLPPGPLMELLHYYTCGVPWVAPSGGKSFDRELHEAGLIRPASAPRPSEWPDRKWEVTDKARVYVEAVVGTPLPVQVWVIPGKDA
jgi:hypothetical protein